MLRQLSWILRCIHRARIDRMPADGLCIFEPVLKDNVRVAVASYADVLVAAQSLYLECAATKSVGGMAEDIGRNDWLMSMYVLMEVEIVGFAKELGLVMASYDPRVECIQGPAPPAENCKLIADHMLYAAVPQNFGNTNDRKVRPDVKLPKTLLEC